MLFNERHSYKPFDVPWAFDAYEQQNQVHWLPQEVPMAEDIYDWKFKLTDSERNFITQVLRFFTQGDVDIGKAYLEKYAPAFPKPELRMMFAAFANAEAVHAHAYSYLIETLGLPESEYTEFFNYREMLNKHDYFFNETNGDLSPVEKLALDVVKFSVFGEGLQLFSSFAMLMNFQRQGKLKGLGQIVAWSCRDESLHCESMVKLFNQIVDENPKIWNSEFKRRIYQCCREMVTLESEFIDLAYNTGGIAGLDKKDLCDYTKHIADRRLLQMRLKPHYKQKDNPLKWFEETFLGLEVGNFFEVRTTEYSKAIDRGSWDAVY